MEKLISGLLLLVGAINFYPIVGVSSPQMLSSLYSIESPTGDLLILLKHRAIMFGLLGGFIVYSAFKLELQWSAIVIGIISMISFVVIAFLIGDYGTGIRKVVIADIITSVLILIAAALRWFASR